MSFATITTEQLDFLYPSRRDSRLETVLRTTRDPMTGEFKGGFESTDACSMEDQNRACALRGLPRKLWPNIPSCDPQRLAGLLDTIIDVRRSKPAPSCLASASYVRSRRIGVLGSILELVRNNPELDVAWLTAGDYNSRFDPKASWPSAIPGARMRFEHQLERSGALTAPGFDCANGDWRYLKLQAHDRALRQRLPNLVEPTQLGGHVSYKRRLLLGIIYLTPSRLGAILA